MRMASSQSVKPYSQPNKTPITVLWLPLHAEKPSD
jgi:hypothetical protein